MENKLIFSTFELYVDNVELAKSAVNGKDVDLGIKTTISADNQKCMKTYVGLRGEYMFMSLYEGRFLPLSSTVFNRELNSEQPNSRTEAEAEWNSQTYGVYNFKNKILYISNINKKCFFELIIKDRILKNDGANVMISNIYKDVDTFVKEISKADKIVFARKNADQVSLFSDPDQFDPKWSVGAESFSVELKYSKIKVFREKVFEFWNLAKKKEISNLICIGCGDDNLEKVFKIDKFIEKISVDVQKNERGLYEDDLVFSTLVSSFES
ncbi:hypothetical protein DDIC_00770 [Desulfovibrio desulfuricans]|uniref:Uncharacterized protein n=1 Tax=Desulfovibrio desulfuricans TaxID=876 RepID=A0A4P7UF21_DESDE|nr:hypothetical protein [Desulfovibrio desulfuricans]QCC84433.1 hypothetical protein DDIC_00770 [Desulfovibrio desulfuricans]